MSKNETAQAVAAFLAAGGEIKQIEAGNAAVAARAISYNPRFDASNASVTREAARQHMQGDRYDGYYAA